MNRKDFLRSASTVAAATAITGISSQPSTEVADPGILPMLPPYLKPGDFIGITAPAGYITLDEILPSIKVMESWGFRMKLGDTIGKRNFTFGGSDEERAGDFQKMLDDPKLKAIMCARGGYGAVRILDKLKWDKFKSKPKWIIGFSDVTVFHSHLNRNIGVASIHSKMCNSFPDDWSRAEPIQIETIESIRKALTGEKLQYAAIPNISNKPGIAEGVLIGGNCKMLETLAGTASDIVTSGKILFLEDTGEYMYNVDRMFWNLKRTGKLSHLKGLILGGFKIKIDEGADDFGKTLQEVVLEKIKGYHFPVCFDFPVGHQKNNYALKCGAKHRLQVNAKDIKLTEV